MTYCFQFYYIDYRTVMHNEQFGETVIVRVCVLSQCFMFSVDFCVSTPLLFTLKVLRKLRYLLLLLK